MGANGKPLRRRVTKSSPVNATCIRLRWSRHRRCVALARAELRRALRCWHLTAVMDEAVLILSELLTNAVRHAHVSTGREIETRFLREASGVRIEVADAASELPVLRVPDEAGGWGLLLVAELSEEWGVVEREGVGKSVWAVVTVSEKAEEEGLHESG